MAAKTKRRTGTMAKQADRYDLYIRAVQAPDVDVAFFDRVFRSHYGRTPEVLREDFCAAAATCAAWVRAGRNRIAYGVDLDPEPLAWGRANILQKLSLAERDRVTLIEADVRTVVAPPADVIAAQNFSYLVFKTRATLLEYFRAARASLRPQGLLILDLLGGYETFEEDREDIVVHPGFEYVWEQERFDPITHDARFHIHFRFKDKSALTRAFTYDWRLWTCPEVQDALHDAGFSSVEVYWEGTDKKTREGNGVYTKRAHGSADPAWNAYIVGVP